MTAKRTPATPLPITTLEMAGNTFPAPRSHRPTPAEYDALIREAKKRHKGCKIRIVARPEFTWGEVARKWPKGGIMGGEWHSIGYVDDLLREWGIRDSDPAKPDRRTALPGRRHSDVHAANAYPKLVEALQQLCAAKAPLDWSPSISLVEAFTFARALLRSLGEE